MDLQYSFLNLIFGISCNRLIPRLQLVEGELYEVDDAKLRQLDLLENHPHFYVRHEEPVQQLSDADDVMLCAPVSVTAWVYMLPSWRDELLEQGTSPLVSYSSRGAHGRPYVEK